VLRGSVGALVLAALTLSGCARGPAVVVDSSWSEKELRLLVVDAGEDEEQPRVIRCDRGPDGALTKCVALPVVFPDEK
jgi:hypothetical protein